MATTYGYAGEFSSDEDVDKLEQQQNERMVQAKFDNNLRPSKKEIEDVIEAIKRLPVDQEVTLSDEILAGLLDYFKTQRGPIVDSTRKLYIKIAMRLIRGDQQSQLAGSDNGVAKDTNGNSNNNVINNNNNNSINLIPKAPQQKADTFSSDEDDEVNEIPVFNRRNVASDHNDENKMDVDSVTPTGPARVSKQVDMSTTDEEDEDDEDDDDDDVVANDNESDDDTSELEELNSESDVMDVTPIKPPASAAVDKEKQGVEAVIAASKMSSRQPESSVKRQPLAHSTPKDPTDTAKKPYTRSQRIATRSATRGKASAELSAKSLSEAKVSADVFIANKQASSKKKYVALSAAIFVAIVAFLLFYFRSSISSSAVPFLGPKIKF